MRKINFGFKNAKFYADFDFVDKCSKQAPKKF